MATVLEQYINLQKNFSEKVINSILPLDKVMDYQELMYRINVLETCQMFVKTAPITTDTKILAKHYQIYEVYLSMMITNQKLGWPADAQQKQRRKTAEESLLKVVQSLRQQFSSFKPTTAELYSQNLTRMITTVLPAWIQYRNTYISLKEE